MSRIDITDTLDYKTKLPVQGAEESNLEYLRRSSHLTSVMDVLKDMTNMSFINMMESEDETTNEYNETNRLLYQLYCRLLKDQERLLKKAGEWNV